MTRALVLLLLVGCAACASRVPPKEGHLTSWTNPEYAVLRPVVVAVLPGATRKARSVGIRERVYDGLVGKRYSPLKPEVVDENVGRDGSFAPSDIDWDATLELRVDRWKLYRSDGLYRADASAVLIHRSGEKLWSCEVEGYPLRTDSKESAKLLAEVFLGHMPVAPPPR